MHPLEGDEAQRAGRLLSGIRSLLPEPEVGYRFQGIAAHILLRLGARILEVKSQGHPDIVATDAEGNIRVEVEVDLGSGRPRLLSAADLASIRPVEKGDRGYFALAELGMFPRWHVVPFQRLELRSVEISPMILGALEDEAVSRAWTREFSAMIVRNESRLGALTYDRLRALALQSRPV
jgi:hypothetical protein